jgi:hypothetical protein
MRSLALSVQRVPFAGYPIRLSDDLARSVMGSDGIGSNYTKQRMLFFSLRLPRALNGFIDT